MSAGYSRKQLQGWGEVKHPIVRQELSFSNIEINQDVREKYEHKVGQYTDLLLSGLGFPRKDELDMELQEHMTISDMHEDLIDAGLRYISSIKDENKG